MPEQYALTNAQARRFVLRWQGLAGPYRFAGAAGVVDYVRQAGCVQYDPVDVCGKNAEIVLFSRVKGFKKATLGRVLYQDRALVEHWDKNMSIHPVEDWPALHRYRRQMADWCFNRRGLAGHRPLLEELRALLQSRGVLNGNALDLGSTENGGWGPSRLSSTALEYLYFLGEAVVHHREGAQRHYAPAAAHLPAGLLAAPDPNPDDDAYHAWHLLRRIGAVGLLWNRPSDAWLCIPDFKAARRQAAFARLLAQGALVGCRVEGFPQPLYAPTAALPLLQEVAAGEKYTPRCEFIAPLDGMMWDRRLIQALFGFHYAWEIYTPAKQRQYGHYVLPVLYCQGFAGRIELWADRRTGTLKVHRYWPEADTKQPRGFAARLRRQVARFAAFNGCQQTVYLPGHGVPEG